MFRGTGTREEGCLPICRVASIEWRCLSEKSIRLRCDRNSELSPGLSVMDYIKQLNYELRKGK